MDSPTAAPEPQAIVVEKSNGTHAAPKLPESERQVREALQGKLRDIANRPISPRMLVELEKTARLAREILVVGKDPNALRDRYSKYAGDNVGGSYSTWEAEEAEASGFANAPGYDVPLPDNSLVEPGFELIPMGSAKSPRNENYGAVVLRELLSLKAAAAERTASPAETITAIAIAREKGLTDIADKLEAQLFGETKK